MGKYLAIMVTLVLTGCASNTLEGHVVVMRKIDAAYCNGDGFDTFQDLGNYYSFKCDSGRRFMVAK